MAKTKERVYNIPLRKEIQKVAEWDRASKAVKATRKFLIRHMKSDDVKLGQHLNMELHAGGRKHPPHHVKVNTYEEGGKVYAELVGAPVERIKEEKVKEPEVKISKDAQKAEAKIEKQEKEKKEILEHPTAKKTKKGKETTFEDKESAVKKAMEERVTKSETPKNERFKGKHEHKE